MCTYSILISFFLHPCKNVWNGVTSSLNIRFSDKFKIETSGVWGMQEYITGNIWVFTRAANEP